MQRFQHGRFVSGRGTGITPATLKDQDGADVTLGSHDRLVLYSLVSNNEDTAVHNVLSGTGGFIIHVIGGAGGSAGNNGISYPAGFPMPIGSIPVGDNEDVDFHFTAEII